MPVRVFVSAGEPSGDRHLAALVDHLGRELGELELLGLGGDALRARGARLLAHVEELSVIGFSEVARRLPFFLRLLRRSLRELEEFRPHVVVPVDYPGFNLRLGARARTRGFPVAYYIAPQVWAWKHDRRPGIRRAVDRMLAVFPFEEPLFREAGIPTTFVGHPLLDAPVPEPPPAAVRERLGVAAKTPLLALLPGSRSQEVRHILSPLLAGTGALRDEGVAVAVSRAGSVPAALYGAAGEAGLPVWEGDAAALARAADAALVASGTATLETGLGGTPLAVVYRTGPVNWILARALVGVRTVGLVNIAAGGTRVPELLQGDLHPAGVEAVARRLLFDAGERREQTAYLDTLSDRLGGRGSARRAAAEVAALVRSRRG